MNQFEIVVLAHQKSNSAQSQTRLDDFFIGLRIVELLPGNVTDFAP